MFIEVIVLLISVCVMIGIGFDIIDLAYHENLKKYWWYKVIKYANNFDCIFFLYPGAIWIKHLFLSIFTNTEIGSKKLMVTQLSTSTHN